VRRVRTTSGDALRLARHAETHSKLGFNLDVRFEGSYSFIGNGVGKGKTITYAEAWKGIKLLKMIKCRI
jgi:hypothetical protein